MKAIRKDGRIIETDMVLTNLLEDPAVKGIVVNGRDVTDKKRAEEALQQSEEKFRNLIENSNDVISLVTTEMKTLYVSPSLKKVMGYTMEERMEKSFLELVHPEDRPAVIERFKKFAADFGATARMEVRALHKDGTYRHVDAIATNLIQHPTMRGIIFNYRDITDRKKAEQALLKFERLSAIGQMAAGMAHEIRNPLSAIFTAAQILKRHEMKTGEKGFADMILENSQRLEKLIQDTLGYARAEKIAPQEAFALQPMLESAIRLCQIQYGPNHKMIKIEWELPSEPLTLWAPPQRVQQILVNLILNAYQIMGKEGTLSLGLAREEEWAVVRVGDTGPGIPENQMARLFEPFFTTKENGSGLGLALSQRIARECGGEIQAQNKESGGAAFVLRLPLEKKGTAS
jgi:PAS domain S-box-containing protein